VPLILVQGTATACRETEAQFPGVMTAAVKDVESHDRCSGPACASPKSKIQNALA
jgi:D-aminopeptidase